MLLISHTRPRIFRLAAIGVIFFFAVDSAVTCPFCAKMTRTLVDEVREADAVVYGKLERVSSTRARLDHEIVVRPALESSSWDIKITLAPDRIPQRQIVFLQRLQDTWVAQRLDTVSPAVAEYLCEVWQAQDQPPAHRLEYFYSKLDSPEPRIATDAYGEFARASYRATKQAAHAYESARIRRWIEDPQTPSERVGLFGLMLGLAGQSSDRDFLDEVIHDPTEGQRNGLDGLLAGLYLLDPSHGESMIVELLRRQDSSSLQKASALAALRFIMADSPPADPGSMLRAVLPALDDQACAGQLIDEFRKAQIWDIGPEVVARFQKLRDPSAIVRFALMSPEPQAKAFIAHLEEVSPASVADARQSLQFEANARGLDLRRTESARP
ncbi:hypothetical protein K2X85_02220 [bacterium]|nr:hypothetical protein [bacterium]